MRQLIRQLVVDETGGVYTVEAILMTMVMGLGLLSGYAFFRDAVTQEFGDTAVALESLDQSFTYTITPPGGAPQVSTYSDPGASITDPVGAPPAGLVLSASPASE